MSSSTFSFKLLNYYFMLAHPVGCWIEDIMNTFKMVSPQSAHHRVATLSWRVLKTLCPELFFLSVHAVVPFALLSLSRHEPCWSVSPLDRCLLWGGVLWSKECKFSVECFIIQLAELHKDRSLKLKPLQSVVRTWLRSWRQLKLI